MVIPEEQPVAETFPDPPAVAIPPATLSTVLYHFEDGLRRVSPYHYTYNTYCKERWRGKTIFEIYGSEYRDRPEGYYKEAILDGQIYVNGIPVRNLDHPIKNGDCVSHTCHRHEPPVTDKPITIVHEDDEMIVINKPAGMPVHPAGRYHYNSVTEIMRSERGGWNPMPCNRLDRLTSGLMFIAKTKRSSNEMMNQLRTRTIKKEYIAMVKGEFPLGDVFCEQPVLAISPKLGLNAVRANGKYAKTLFRRISYNPKRGYSVIQCLPFTGRTHQIRVHLQFLGHPIANDPIYCNRKVFGFDLGKGGTEGRDEDIITRLSKMGKEEVAEAVAYYDEMVDDYEKKRAEKMSGEVCDICQTPLYTDPGQHELGIYLHARKYQCVEGKWIYETGLPDWAIPKEGEAIITDGVPLESIDIPSPEALDPDDGEALNKRGGTGAGKTPSPEYIEAGRVAVSAPEEKKRRGRAKKEAKKEAKREAKEELKRQQAIVLTARAEEDSNEELISNADNAEEQSAIHASTAAFTSETPHTAKAINLNVEALATGVKAM